MAACRQFCQKGPHYETQYQSTAAAGHRSHPFSPHPHCDLCFLARYLTGSETLADYARENPKLAYGTKKSDKEADSLSQNADTETMLTDKVEAPASQTTPVSDSVKGEEHQPNAASEASDTRTTPPHTLIARAISLSRKRRQRT